MSSSVVVAVVVLVVIVIRYAMRGGAANTSKGSVKSTPKGRSTSWGYATHKSTSTKRMVKLEREWWPHLDRIGAEFFDVKTKNLEALVGTYVDVWGMGNPSHDDGERWLEFEGGKVVKDSNGEEYLLMSRKYHNAQAKNGMLCRWSNDRDPVSWDKKDVYSMQLDVFTLTVPWPWHREKDDPFRVSFAFIDNRVKKGMTSEEIANDVEAKWAKDREKRERQEAKSKAAS